MLFKLKQIPREHLAFELTGKLGVATFDFRHIADLDPHDLVLILESSNPDISREHLEGGSEFNLNVAQFRVNNLPRSSRRIGLLNGA